MLINFLSPIFHLSSEIVKSRQNPNHSSPCNWWVWKLYSIWNKFVLLFRNKSDLLNLWILAPLVEHSFVMNINFFKHTNVSSIILLLSTLGVVMEQVKFDYSMKNIPIPSKQEFMTQMIHSVEYFVKNIRWRAFFFLNPPQSNHTKETFSFRLTSPAPFVPELRDFELKLYDLTKNIRFRNYSNSFQTKLVFVQRPQLHLCLNLEILN